MNSRLSILAAGFALVAGTVFAQQPAPKPPTPAPTGPPPATPPPTQPATPAAQPPRPFPEGAKFAYVNVQRIAQESSEGKAATAKINALREKKEKELQERNTQLEAARKKLETSQSVIADAARQQQQKDIERMTLDLQRATQDAQAEVEELQRELQMDFQRKLLPLIEEVRAAKQLHLIFSSLDSGILAADTGLDITPEVIKRLDTGPAKK
jgi:outer membrane protein